MNIFSDSLAHFFVIKKECEPLEGKKFRLIIFGVVSLLSNRGFVYSFKNVECYERVLNKKLLSTIDDQFLDQN